MKKLIAIVAVLASASLATVVPADAARGGGGRGGSGGHGGPRFGGHNHQSGGAFHGQGHRSGFHGHGGHGFRGHFPARVAGGRFYWGVGPYWGGYWGASYWYPPYYYPPAYYAPSYYSPAYSPGYNAVEPQSYIQSPAPSYWYFCESSQAYYPYVQQCPGGWLTVTPSTGSEPQR